MSTITWLPYSASPWRLPKRTKASLSAHGSTPLHKGRFRRSLVRALLPAPVLSVEIVDAQYERHQKSARRAEAESRFSAGLGRGSVVRRHSTPPAKCLLFADAPVPNLRQQISSMRIHPSSCCAWHVLTRATMVRLLHATHAHYAWRMAHGANQGLERKMVELSEADRIEIMSKVRSKEMSVDEALVSDESQGCVAVMRHNVVR